MTRMMTIGVFLAAVMAATAARAQTRVAGAEVCVSVDEAHDTFSPEDRTAALLLVAKQFELAGWLVMPEGCSMPYTVSHVRLGNTIVVSLSGPNRHWEGTALGLDDLPALYSQMIRSVVTGRPMSGMNVVDRTNVTASQASPLRVQSDSFGYARLGYGGIFGDRSYGAPAFGLGYRVELDSFGIDVSFFNMQVNTSNSYYGSSNGATAGSYLKLEVLHFLNPTANAAKYVGGGVSWGSTEFGRNGGVGSGGTNFRSNWHGSGLQGELTAGYEFPRASTLRLFVQADAVLPFYKVTAETITFSRTAPLGAVTTAGHHYSPSLVVSAGLGWQRDRRGRR